MSQKEFIRELCGHSENADSRCHWVYKVSLVAAIALEILFLIGAISLIIPIVIPETINGYLMLIQNNWLIVLFKLNVFPSEAYLKLLNLNLLDSIILILAGITFLGLYTTFRPISKTWTIIALAQPFIGMLLFIITKMTGRLGIMAAMIIISFMMLRSDRFRKITAVIGILAGLLLILGDAFTQVTFSLTNSILISIGYTLMVAWFFAIILRLLRLGRLEGKTLLNNQNPK